MRLISLIFMSALLAGCVSTTQPDSDETGSTALPDGAAVEEGVWDFGNCAGNDRHMCRREGEEKTGCVRPASECASGTAMAVAWAKGDNLCTIEHWRWECQASTYRPSDDASLAARVLEWRSGLEARHRAFRVEIAQARAETYPIADCDLTGLSENAITVGVRFYSGIERSSLPDWSYDSKPKRVAIAFSDELQAQRRPIILSVGAYSPVEWEVVDGLHLVEAIIANGYGPQRVVAPTKWQREHPILLQSYETDEPPGAYCRPLVVGDEGALWRDDPHLVNAMLVEGIGHTLDVFYNSENEPEDSETDTIVVGLEHVYQPCTLK